MYIFSSLDASGSQRLGNQYAAGPRISKVGGPIPLGPRGGCTYDYSSTLKQPSGFISEQALATVEV